MADRMLLSIDLPVSVTWRSRGSSTDPRGLELRVGRRAITLRSRYNFEHPEDWNPDGGKPFWRRSQRGGLYTESKLPLPRGLMLELHEQRMDYAQATKFPYSLDWVIDEFDASFDALAAASLRYHMDWSVCECPADRRQRYQGLIDRLTERPPRLSTDEHAVLEAVHANRTDGDFFGTKSSTPEQLSAYEAVSAAMETRREEWEARAMAARHDFIDITRELWS